MSLPSFLFLVAPSLLRHLSCRWRRRRDVIGFFALALFVGGAPFQAAAQAGDRTQYIVDGLALGDPVQPNSATYRQYQCSPSEQFASFIWCQRRRTGNGKFGKFTSVNSILHSPDGTTAYISQHIDPAYFVPGDVEREIKRLSQLFGSRSHILRSPRRPGEAEGVIAYWGGVALEPLDAESLGQIAAGKSVRRGMLFDFLGDFGRSAREGFPIYQLGGSAGYVWGSRFDKSGWGSLRITAIDASQFTAPALAAGPGNLAFSMDQCRNGKEPAVKVDQCSVIISQSADPKIRERAFNRRGHAYMALNRFAEAAHDFTAVIRLNPRIAGYYDNRQNALRALGQMDDALADANEAVRLAPAYSFVYGGRGNVFTDMGRYDLALQDYATAISLDPKNAGLFVGRGKIFVKVGRLREAIADFTHALEMDNTMTAALRERGLTYKLQGNFDAALFDLSLFLRLQPNDEEIVQALEDMPPVTRRSEAPPVPLVTPPVPTPERREAERELENRFRIEKRDRLVSAAKQVIEEASAFIQADPRNPKLLDFADQIRLLNSATAESDPDRIEEQMRKLEEQIGILSAALHKEPVFRKMETERNEARKRDNALYLADTIKTAQTYKAFLVGYITRNAATQTAGYFVPLVKEIDAALNVPDLGRLSPLNEKVDLAIRQAGLRNDFLAMPPPADLSEPAEPSPPQSLQLSTTDKNKFLVEGDLQDVVLLFNSSPSAPHVAKNLRGEIIFEDAKADVCLFQQDFDATLANTLRMALGCYSLKTISIDPHACPSEHVLAYDVVAAKRGAFLRQEVQYAASLIKEIETDHLKRLLILTDVEVKSALAADAIKASEIETDIERGAKEGYGLILLNTGSPAVCAVIMDKANAHRLLLVSLGDRLTSEMKISPMISAASLDGAFINIQRKQCGGVYASAQDLKTLLDSLKHEGISYLISAIWVTQPEIDAADKKIADEKALTAQQALERERRTEEQRKLRERQTQEEAASKAKQQESLRSQFGKTAAAAAATIGNEVKQFTELRGGNAATKFPVFASWHQRQLADRWELMSQNAELFDYGVSNWKGRGLETSFAKVNMRLRNPMLGEYKDACFIFGQIVDTEFRMDRDPVSILCDNSKSFANWKTARGFQSTWIVE